MDKWLMFEEFFLQETTTPEHMTYVHMAISAGYNPSFLFSVLELSQFFLIYLHVFTLRVIY